MYKAKILNKKSINRGNTFHQKKPTLKNKIVEKFIPNERYVLNIERNNPVETFNKKVHAIAKYQTKVIIFGQIRSSQLMLRTYLWSKRTLKTIANVRRIYERKYIEWSKWQCKAVCQYFKPIWPEYGLVQLRPRMPNYPWSKEYRPNQRKHLWVRKYENFEDIKRAFAIDGRALVRDWNNKEKHQFYKFDTEQPRKKDKQTQTGE